MPRRFGEIDGYPAGSWLPDRHALAASGLHSPLQAGISGDREFGAESIVLSGGYEDDEDFGDTIVYTGQGGNEDGRQVAPQALVRGNLALARSCVLGRPVRVIRGSRHNFRHIPELHLPTGYRYDGLYRVESYWRSLGHSGLPIWRFRLVRLLYESMPATTLRGVAENRPGYDDDQPGNRDPAPRQATTIQRIVRNTDVAMSIKQLYAARCQVCGTAIATPGGDYAEAAHIRPLGAPHDGPDHPSNVLCLCPNHHVMFDLGGIVIRDDFTVMEPVSGAILSSLHVHPDHQIDPSHIRYHRSLFMDDAVVPFERDSVDFRTSRERGQSSEQSKLFG